MLDVRPESVVEGPVAAGGHRAGVAALVIACSQPEASQVTSDRRSLDAQLAGDDRADSPVSAIIRTRVAALLLWLRS